MGFKTSKPFSDIIIIERKDKREHLPLGFAQKHKFYCRTRELNVRGDLRGPRGKEPGVGSRPQYKIMNKEYRKKGRTGLKSDLGEARL